jgi:hypothetical protein
MKTIHTLFALIALTISFNTIAVTEQTTQTRVSSSGVFTVTMNSWLKPLRLGKMHAWQAEIKTSDGKPVAGAKIKIGGGMPIHNHGFPTQPIMTSEKEPGLYILEGFKFSMRGPWIIYLDISANGKTDSVAFDINM